MTRDRILGFGLENKCQGAVIAVIAVNNVPGRVSRTTCSLQQYMLDVK